MTRRQQQQSTHRLRIAKDQHKNLFVRLSREVLSTLVADASQELLELPRAVHAEEDDVQSWQFVPTEKDTTTTFLPLELQLGDCTLYASFNGGILDELQDTVQIPQALLPPSFAEPTRVLVKVLPRVPVATRVQVDPVSIEDWELLQVHAELLEHGMLLNQLSIVYQDQRLEVIPPGSTNENPMDRIHVVVKEILTVVDDPSSSIWPESSSYDDSPQEATEQQVNIPNVAMLKSNTEIVISPKPRDKRADPTQWTGPLQIIPGVLDSTPLSVVIGTNKREPYFSSTTKVSPGRILVHPLSLPFLESSLQPHNNMWVQIKACTSETEIVRLVQLELCNDIPEQTAVVHPWLRWDLGLALFWSQIQLRLSTVPIWISMEDVNLQGILWRPFANSQGKPWRQPQTGGFQNPTRPLAICINDGNEKAATLELPMGSICSLTTQGSKNDGPKDESYCFRLVLKPDSMQYPADRLLVRLTSSTTALDALVANLDNHLRDDNDALDAIQVPATDQVLGDVPEFVFQETLDALNPFVTELRQGASFVGVLTGANGSGKTHTALILGAIARQEHFMATLYLDCKTLLDSTKVLGEILSELDDVFASAADATRCLVLLDDLDRIAPNLLGGGNEGDPGAQLQGVNPTAVDQAKVIADRILQLVAATNYGKNSVSIVATCASVESVHTSICQDELAANVPTLNGADRRWLYSHFLKVVGVDEIRDGLPIDVFSRATEGFRPRDLQKLASRVRRFLALGNDRTISTMEATETVLRDFTPLARIGLDNIKPKAGLSWNEIGGLFEVKKKLEAALLRPVKYRAIYQQAKIRLPRGFLLVGPTGCGKSCIVPALAQECKFPLIVCKGPEILDKYIGASEAKIRDLFQRAAAVAPSILFLDELDALAPRRGSDHTGVTDRVVNQLLTFLDGVEDTSSNSTVYVIGASSRPDKIDPALLRPGRLEQHLFVGPPETKEEWVDLMWKIAVGWRLSKECRDYLFSSHGADEIVSQLISTPFVCPADIKAAMDTAQLNAIHRTLKTQKPEDLEFIDIEVEDLRLSMSNLRPCLTQDDAQSLGPIYERFHPNSKMIGKDVAPKTELKTTLR